MGGHAVLSPSSASRWLACTPSARLEELFPDSAGEFAKEGGLAHELGETILRFKTGEIKKAAYQRQSNVVMESNLFSAEMWEYADNYAVFVLEELNKSKAVTKDAVLFIERKLDMTKFVPEGFGTGDAIIIADGVMKMIDLKYGKGVAVSCKENKQMMLYALGALEEFDLLYDIQSVQMTIYQPRLDNISTWEMSVTDLVEWATKELKPKAELAFEGKGTFVSGDHCRFCRAKAKCKALAEDSLEIEKYQRTDGALLSDTEVTDILNRADAIKKWLTSVEEYALKEAVEHGKKWPEMKLVEGRSVRTYTNQDKVAETLQANGYEAALIYKRSLLGITDMEKLLSKKGFEELLSDLVVKPQGKPALVPESDKRPEWSSAAADFAGIEIED